METDIPSEYLSIQTPTEDLDDGLTPVKYLEYTPENRKLAQTDPDNYMLVQKRVLIPSSVIMSGHNTSIYSQLGDLGKNIVNGPYNLVGRDNTLILKNSSANKKTIASYTYCGGEGELLEFEIETEMSTAVEVSKTSDIDPDDKSYVTQATQVIPNTDAMYADGRILWFKPGDLGKTPLDIPPDNTDFIPGVSLPFVSKTPGKTEDDIQRRIDNAYESKSAAVADLSANYQVTDQDVQKYWQALVDKFQSIKEVTTQAELNILLRELGELEPYIIEIKVYIISTRDPIVYSSIRPYGNNQSGSSMGSRVPPTPYAIEAHRVNRWKDGYKHLKKDPTITIIPKDYQVGDEIDVIEEKVVTIPIPGIRILASANFRNAPIVMGNDLIKDTLYKIKAKAKILGRPSLEEGMNIEIKNVSSRYSGVWHISKISHDIDNSGYTCNIEFVQKSLPMKHNTITAKVNTQKAFSEINNLAIESQKTEAYNIPSRIEQVFMEWRKDNGEPDTQYLIVTNKDNPRKATVYKASEDFKSIGQTSVDDRVKVLEIDLNNE